MQHLSWAVCELRCEQCKDFFSLEGFVAWLAMQMFTSWKMKNCIPLHLEYYWYYVESGQDGFVSWIMDYTDYTTNYWNCPWTLIRLDTFNAPKPCTVQFSYHRQDDGQRSLGLSLWCVKPLCICMKYLHISSKMAHWLDAAFPGGHSCNGQTQKPHHREVWADHLFSQMLSWIVATAPSPRIAEMTSIQLKATHFLLRCFFQRNFVRFPCFV